MAFGCSRNHQNHSIFPPFDAKLPLPYIAAELGWIVTEVGRQPWGIHGGLRTADAVTPMPGLAYTFLFLALHLTSIRAEIAARKIRQIQMAEIGDR